MSVLLNREEINPVPAALQLTFTSIFSFVLLFGGINFLAPSTSYAREFLPWLLENGVWYASLAVLTFLVIQGAYTCKYYRSAEIAIVQDKLAIRIGVLNHKEKQIPLNEIKYTSTYSNFLQSRFGVKDIKIYTSGTAGVSWEIVGVKRQRADALVRSLRGEEGQHVA